MRPVATVGRQRGTRGRHAATTAALLAATVTAALTAGCTGGGGPGDDGRRSARESEQGTSPSATGASVLAVKLDNAAAARPHTGVDAADVVYAEQVEGGLSRLMAVYATQLPKTVGPVRSARESDLELLRQFDRPTLAFSGAQKKLLPLIDRAPLRAETPGSAPDAYSRGSGKPAPHNLYLRPERLIPEAPGQAALTTGFRYGTAPSGGTATTSQTVRYPAARFTFTWSDSRDRWLVGMDGAPATTADGKRMAAATVVVQYVKVRESAFRDFLGNNTPYTETVGSGKATVLRDGRAHAVNWKRADATDGTAFTTGDGTPVNFAKGQVWVVYAKAS
ncbi:DUF3048 domain-containing protein [Streptomyces caelestis]|uniref:DUF3048 domain-containing protein n=1 Tax=Streptomyces caelestis TaxID=36816 RepID=UPI00160980EF|nr:DUF3048 domain-containing protein [Streptomyces caelestis]